MTSETPVRLPLSRWQLPSLLLGGVLILNALICTRFSWGDFSSALCALGALALIIPHLIAIVRFDFASGRHHMNELVLVAVAAATAQGDAQGFITGAGIAFFLLIGLMIENHSAAGARTSLEEIAQMTSGKIRRIESNGSEKEILPEALIVGDRIRIRPGEVIPADGEILHGNSTVQEANITGESLPVEKGAGDSLFAGTLNLSGAPEVKVTQIGAQTVIGKVRELILEAEKSRPAFVRMIDSYARYYTPLVFMTAFFVWIAFDHDWSRVVSVLVAACPIALVLSTPSAAVAALSAAARLGVLIKNIGDIEILSEITAFVFDKTGTLTSGSLEVVTLAPLPGVESESLLAAACAAGQNSNHPVSLAVCELGRRVNLPAVAVSDWSETPGCGIRCTTPDGLLCSGNLAWLRENGVAEKDSTDDEYQGMSLLYVALNGHFLGWIALHDPIRPEAKAMIAALKKEERQVMMVTGDREPVAKAVSTELEIPHWFSHCKPTDKIEKIESLKANGEWVAFVGDGVNDGPALAAGNIGIAMGAAGNNLAIETASIALMNNRLDRIILLRDLSSDYRRIMIQNFVLGFLIILGGISAGILLPPQLSTAGYGALISAGLQAAGAIAVTLNSARLLRTSETK